MSSHKEDPFSKSDVKLLHLVEDPSAVNKSQWTPSNSTMNKQRKDQPFSDNSNDKMLNNQTENNELKSGTNGKMQSGFESPFPLRKRSPSVTDRIGGKVTSSSTPHMDDDLQKILQKRLSRELDPTALQKTEFAIARSMGQGKPPVETRSASVS